MYNRPRIIPVLLIDDRDLVKTVRFGERTYLGDPVNAVKIFNRKYVDELAVLDIAATKERREPDCEILRDIASEAFMPLSYGGGLSSIGQIRDILATGYEKAVLNSALVEDPDLVREAAETFGSQSIVASIDAKKGVDGYECFIHDGAASTGVDPLELAVKAESLGVGEIILNSIDNDGMMEGYDLELVRMVSDAVSIPVVALGGAGGVGDLKKALRDGHAHAAAAGSMFVYYGRLKAVLIQFPAEAELLAEGIY
ncbi:MULTISPECIES: AglZ/HisF2 family acetamidino modification protein [unclassified Adlercreutzia]|uniref:AglZ/HisF2 family acetamidino modification protein n=1 Tax=unclassified Adlercreutzia TaxID=2636013 RepID=UPI0013EAF478|nr:MULTISPECIES: AglZ/HisF2 family acetamidino modification protein [unclassified Adlercreutzia]